MQLSGVLSWGFKQGSHAIPQRSAAKHSLAPLQDVEVAADVDFGAVAELCEGFSGDDITNICRDAAMNGMRTLIAGKTPDQIRCRTIMTWHVHHSP